MQLRTWLFENRITQRDVVIAAAKIGINLHQSTISALVNNQIPLSENGRDRWRQVLKEIGMTAEEINSVDILKVKKV